jgi:hypothetical protein
VPATAYTRPAIVETLFKALTRRHGLERARAMLAQGMSLAVFVDVLGNLSALNSAIAMLKSGEFDIRPELAPGWYIAFRRSGTTRIVTSLDGMHVIAPNLDQRVPAGQVWVCLRQEVATDTPPSAPAKAKGGREPVYDWKLAEDFDLEQCRQYQSQNDGRWPSTKWRRAQLQGYFGLRGKSVPHEKTIEKQLRRFRHAVEHDRDGA